jgi:tetratricopeptide (TPR) repeat protein
MDVHRIKQLEKFIREDPNDPFPKYALALECQSQNPDKASTLFKELLEGFPNYSATYFHAADFFYQMDETDLAKETYEKGIAVLKKGSDQKALSELQNAYQNFLIEMDD